MVCIKSYIIIYSCKKVTVGYSRDVIKENIRVGVVFQAPAAHHLLPLPMPSVLLLEPIKEVSKRVKFNIKKHTSTQKTDKPSLGLL